MKLFELNWFKKPDNGRKELETPRVTVDISPLPSIVLIHGANQTNLTFEYVRNALPGFTFINIDWSPSAGFKDNLAAMINAVKESGYVYLVGHSMGGIYAAHLSQHVDCIGGATIASPWAGSKAANFLKYVVPSDPIYREVQTKSVILKEAREFNLPGRWTNYVTTRGDLPGLGGANDCVLTYESMTARADLHTKFIDATHYEVVMSPLMVQSLANNFLKATEKTHLRG